MLPCPSPEQLHDLLAERLSGPEAEAIAAHLEECIACQQALEPGSGPALPGMYPEREQTNKSGASPATTGDGDTDFLRRLAQSPPPEVQQATVWPAESSTITSPSPELPVVTGYEILDVLGRGGMGVVYRARQCRLDRLVALKMIRDGELAGAEEQARFRTEAEAAARLQHPHIVQIFEVGEQAGRPFLSLEFVDGGSLAQQLAGNPQPARQAAQLVTTLARAVHHAHQRHVIHRDLKPANILITRDGTPKITDFGLAKRLDVPTGPTLSGVPMGTPSYMAPEQAQGALEHIGPATDVYALGAVLYEMLTGRPPFRGASVLETLEQVREVEPVPPSRLQPKVPRDLETICLKCLQKEPGKRYGGAELLAEDLLRFLEGKPIVARPVRAWERGVKWARRRPAVAALLLALLLVLSGSVPGLTWLWLRADTERRRAEQNLAKSQAAEANASAAHRFLRDALLEVARPEKKGYAVTIQEALDKASPKISQAFAGHLDGEASVRTSIGLTYLRLGRHPEAEPHLRRAFELYREVSGEEHPDTLSAANDVARLLMARGEFSEAEPLFRQNLEARRRVLGPDHPDTLTALNNLALSLKLQKKLAEAEPLYRESLEACGRLMGGDSLHTLRAVNNLAVLLQEQGKLTEAEPLFRQGLETFRRIHGPDYPNTLIAVNNLADLLQEQGKLDEAEPLLRQNVEAFRRTHGPEHSKTLITVNNLASLLRAQGRLDEAEVLHRQNLDARRRVLGTDHPDTLITGNNLASLLLAQGKLAEAEPLCRQNLDACRRVLKPDHPRALIAVNNLAFLLQAQGKLAEAEPLFREALQHGRKALPGNDITLANSLVGLGLVLVEQGQAGEAEPLLRESLTIRRQVLAKGHRDAAVSEGVLGDCLTKLGRYRDAEALLQSSYEALQKARGASTKQKRKALDRLVQLYEASGQAEKAAAWRARRDEPAPPTP
jgi:serine/threonine protein kinase/Tfp pilus assembly protein PilF